MRDDTSAETTQSEPQFRPATPEEFARCMDMADSLTAQGLADYAQKIRVDCGTVPKSGPQPNASSSESAASSSDGSSPDLVVTTPADPAYRPTSPEEALRCYQFADSIDNQGQADFGAIIRKRCKYPQ